MKIVFHEQFLETYTADPAASPGRLDHALDRLQKHFSFVTPSPCSEEDVLLVHTSSHLENVRRDKAVFDMALLAAGATIKASQLAMADENSFALCRPPGHHASPSSCWGFCYFNNVAIAVERLLRAQEINRALIVDFDLHYGDGTNNIFAGSPQVHYWHVRGESGSSLVESIRDYLERVEADIVAVSAGFDRHVNDWGGMFKTEDYRAMGKELGVFAREHCQGRLFAALEGGYNAHSLGESALAFCQGVASAAQ